MPTATSAPTSPATQRFRAAVDSPSGTGATSFLKVPLSVVEALGAGKRPKVKVTFNDYSYRSTVAVYDGEFYLPVRREVREGARITFGEPMDVTLELDTAPREVEVPDQLAASLARDDAARAAFDKLSFSHRKEYVDWITGAKRKETRRQQRVEKMLAMLRDSVRTPKT
jgi:Bacteriocin-protection, YdeI or OmpD-Associated/Domain of unknown function (DUF1905)